MGVQVALRRVSLVYADGLVMHTALSGPVSRLDELRLIVHIDGVLAALGSTRVNIQYLTGIDPERLVGDCHAMAASLDWSDPAAALAAACRAPLPDPARLLFEIAAADHGARAAGKPLSVFLGGPAAAAVPTNQSLFRAADDVVLARAARYLARGFRDLKLRIGFGDFTNDLALLRRLRNLDPNLSLAADANGAWIEANAARNLDALAPLGLRYLEQPVSAWESAARIASSSPVPIMLDESLADMASVQRLARAGAAPLAHLKLAKLGGTDRLLQAGALLQSAGIGIMVGQMNEGVVSTLAAAHVAVALAAPLCELYGADGIENDPAGALRYAEGALHVPAGPGLGLAHHDDTGTQLWEARF